MKFLVDEMFSPQVAQRLADLGHDALHVRDIGLAGATDDEVLRFASREGRVVVTENAVDFVTMLDAAVGAGEVPPPVVLALKRTLPASAGGTAHALPERLTRWAEDHPDPYPHVHWLG